MIRTQAMSGIEKQLKIVDHKQQKNHLESNLLKAKADQYYTNANYLRTYFNRTFVEGEW